MVKWVIIAALVLAWCIAGAPEFLLGGAPYWVRAISYSFFHASWWHLAANCLAVWSIYRFHCKPCRDLVVPLLIAIAVYPLSFRPVIGFSNVLYACLGARTPSIKSPWWVTSNVWVFIVVTIALAVIPQFSATTHIAAFILGMGWAALTRFHNSLNRDISRYIG